jgi:hypothetical protein
MAEGEFSLQLYYPPDLKGKNKAFAHQDLKGLVKLLSCMELAGFNY